MGVPCLFPARNLVWLTVSPEEALASGEGACQGDAGVTGRSWRYIGQRASGWVVKVLWNADSIPDKPHALAYVRNDGKPAKTPVFSRLWKCGIIGLKLVMEAGKYTFN